MIQFCNPEWSRVQALIGSIYIRLKELCQEEFGHQRAQMILFMPIFLALGIGVYFSLGHEPPFWLGAAAVCISLICLLYLPQYFKACFICLLCIAIGFSASKIRTTVVYTPIIEKSLTFKMVEGRVVKLEILDKGARITLEDPTIEGLSDAETPRKVRLKLWKHEGFEVGQTVKGLASLNPPSPPVMPRGFDFQRYMYFQGIGAVGFFYKPPEIIGNKSGLGVLGYIEWLRQVIGERVEEAIGSPESGLARALMIGQRTSISEDNMEAIRASGLAHMLAISGLHVGLFSGTVFFLLRFGCAFFPSIALRYPIKKYAAIVAMLAAFFYMLIAGSTIPTQRAMISVAVVFTAILLDRSPISLRVVAFAAFCVLLFFPESLMSASFQMSFAAVTVLVAFYDWTRPLWSKWSRQSGILKKALLYYVGVASTTVLATLATAPLTLYHFQALPVYGLLANIICVPLLGFFIMPLAILSFLLMPFGLEVAVLIIMEPALAFILQLANWIEGLDGAVFHVPVFSLSAMVFFVLMMLSLISLRARIRVILVSFFGLCGLINFQVIQYDVLVSSKLDLTAFKPSEPYLILSDARKSRFVRDNWKRAFALKDIEDRKFPREGRMAGEDFILMCDVLACRYEFGAKKISHLMEYDLSAYQDECEWADIVITGDIYRKECAADFLVNRGDGKYHGAHAFILNENIIMHRTEDFRGDRPWVKRR